MKIISTNLCCKYMLSILFYSGNSVKRLSSGQKVEMFLKSTKAKTKSLKRQKAKIVDVIIESDSDEPSPKKKKLWLIDKRYRMSVCCVR